MGGRRGRARRAAHRRGDPAQAESWLRDGGAAVVDVDSSRAVRGRPRARRGLGPADRPRPARAGRSPWPSGPAGLDQRGRDAGPAAPPRDVPAGIEVVVWRAEPRGGPDRGGRWSAARPRCCRRSSTCTGGPTREPAWTRSHAGLPGLGVRPRGAAGPGRHPRVQGAAVNVRALGGERGEPTDGRTGGRRTRPGAALARIAARAIVYIFDRKTRQQPAPQSRSPP